MTIRCQCCQNQPFVLSHQVFKIRLVFTSITKFTKFTPEALPDTAPFSHSALPLALTGVGGWLLGLPGHQASILGPWGLCGGGQGRKQIV